MSKNKYPELKENFPDLMREEDAKKKGIKIREDWRNAKKGEFILTIDGIVLEILDRTKDSQSRDRKPTIYLHTDIGKFPTTISCVYARRVPFNEDSDINVGSHLNKVFVEDLKLYGKLGPNGQFTPESIIKSYKSVYAENNDVTALMRGRNILKKEWVKKYMSKQLKKSFLDQDWNTDKLAKKYIEFIESNKIPATVRKQCLDVMRESFDVPDDAPDETLKLLFSKEDQKKLEPIVQILALYKSWEAQDKIMDAEFVEEVIKLLPPKK